MTPSGLVVLVGALASAACGAAAGRAMLDHARGGSGRRFVVAGLTVVGAAALGSLAAASFAPAFKRLWSAPFGLGVAAAAAAALLILHVVLDGRRVPLGERVVRYPLVSLGRNSLLVYFGSHAVTSVLLRTSPTGQIPTKGENLAHLWQRDLAGWVDVEGAAWPLCVVAVLAWTLLAMLLHSRRIYVKA